jgi:hypothetical protein
MPKPNALFNFNTIELAFEYANFGDHSNEAYLDRHTGNSLYFSMHGDSDEEPDDIDDTTRYVAIPDRRDFGLGSQLAIQFATENAPSLLDDVYDAFRGRGGFRRFKDLLDRNNLLDAWHEYEAEQERTAIIKWCLDNDIRYTMDDPTGE